MMIEPEVSPAIRESLSRVSYNPQIIKHQMLQEQGTRHSRRGTDLQTGKDRGRKGPGAWAGGVPCQAAGRPSGRASSEEGGSPQHHVLRARPPAPGPRRLLPAGAHARRPSCRAWTRRAPRPSGGAGACAAGACQPLVRAPQGSHLTRRLRSSEPRQPRCHPRARLPGFLLTGSCLPVPPRCPSREPPSRSLQHPISFCLLPCTCTMGFNPLLIRDPSFSARTEVPQDPHGQGRTGDTPCDAERKVFML